MVIAFRSIVALCAFAGLATLVQDARGTNPAPARDVAARPETHLRTGQVLRSHGQASGPS